MTVGSGKSSQEDTRDLTATAPGMLAPLLLRASEAAELCSASVRTWRSWDAAGSIPSPIHIGRSAFWRLEELRAWIDAGCPRRDVWLARK